MLTPITCLNEIVSVVPGNPRQFWIDENETMGIDPDKAIAARTFTGVLLKEPIDDDNQQTDGESCKFIEVFYQSGVNITTLFTEELKKQLFKDVKAADKPQEPDTANPYNPFNRRKGDINSWN